MTFVKNTTNSKDNQIDNHDTSDYIIDVTLFVLGAVIASCSLIVLNTFLSKLNKIMKNILNVLCIHTAINFGILAIVCSIWPDDKDTVICSIMQVLERSTGMIVFEHLPFLSFIRFHLTSKRAKNENPNEKLIKLITVSMYLVEYTTSVLIATLTMTNLEASCLQDSSAEVDSLNIINGALVSICCVGIELYHDNQLIGLLKSMNEQSRNGPQGGSRLIPWTSNNQEYDFVIPIKAFGHPCLQHFLE